MAKKVAATLELPLRLDKRLAREVTRVRRKDGTSYLGDNAPPELSLMVAVVVVLKLVYGLDGKER